MTYDPLKHHRQSLRLTGFNYGQPGYYFVTICSKNGECLFSEITFHVGAGLAPAPFKELDHIREIDIKLTSLGQILDDLWRTIPDWYENVGIDEYIIMPNHLHGVINIKNTLMGIPARGIPTLNEIIGSFKSLSVVRYLKYINHRKLNRVAKFWQKNFHEHIVRNDYELIQIRKYIIDNPVNWQDDRYNPKNK